MLSIKQYLRFVTFSLFFVWQYVAAEAVLVPQTALVPSTKHAHSTALIIKTIESTHYRKKTIDDTLSSAVFDMYLSKLDVNRNIFFADDVQAFAGQYRYQLDDALITQQLEPAFEIFKVFRMRLKERIDQTISILQDDFDFTTDEEYVFDRRDADWISSVDEMNALWRQRVKNDLLNLILLNKSMADAKDTLKKRYQRLYSSMFQLDANDIFELFINAYTTSIDPHTSYFSPRVSENFDISMRLSLEGIGAVLRSEHDYTLVQKIIPGGPADLSNKLHSKDKIIGVGQGRDGEIVDVIGWRLDDVVDLIRGPKNTVLRLHIIPSKIGSEDVKEVIMLTRSQIKLEESAAQSKVITLNELDKKVGVIDIPAFYTDFSGQAKGHKNFRSTSRDVQQLIAELKQQPIAGIVIDLRGNSGGSLLEALLTTGLFIREGPIVQTKNSAGGISINFDPNRDIFYQGPLAVLVDRGSASASEIFAGAIQDYKRGIIIGEPTYGKGTVQTIIDLNRLSKDHSADYGKLKTTIQQFFRISGSSNQNKGVIPDIIFPTAFNIDEHGERSLENALPWAEIDAAPYNELNIPSNLYAETLTLHKKRIHSDRAFALLRKQLEFAEKGKNKQAISLNESKRNIDRDKRLETIYEIENELRIAQGLTPLSKDEQRKKTQEIDEFSNDTADSEDQPHDILLQESARIISDLYILSDHNYKKNYVDNSD